MIFAAFDREGGLGESDLHIDFFNVYFVSFDLAGLAPDCAAE